MGDPAVRAGLAVARDDGPTRSAVLWRLRHGGRRARRPSSSPRSGRWCNVSVPTSRTSQPIEVRAGQVVDRDALVESLVAVGYRREYQVEGRGEVAVRGSIVDVYPVTDDHPSASTSGATRSTASRRSPSPTNARPTTSTRSQIFPARELLPTAEVRARAEALQTHGAVGRRAVGAPRHRAGVRRDGVLAAVAHPRGAAPPRPARPTARWCCSREPNRMRDRGPGAPRRGSVAGGHARPDLGRATGDFPPPVAAVRPAPRPHRRRGRRRCSPRPKGPDTAHLAGTAFAPIAGDADHLARRLHGLAADGYRVVIAAEGHGSAARLIRSSPTTASTPAPTRSLPA